MLKVAVADGLRQVSPLERSFGFRNMQHFILNQKSKLYGGTEAG